MKEDSQVRFTIIGLGNLMDVIWHCLSGCFGGENLAQRAIATTADAANLERKRAFFGIPVQLENNLSALEANRPDIIFFAPPPTIAPGEIDTTLRDYFTLLRRQPSAIPEIYAFPPMPPGDHYRKVLGEDVLVANIIPNNVHRIGGRPVVDEGFYACSFSGNWPDASRQRLQRAFASQGAMVEVPPGKLVPMLGGTCTIFGLWHFVPTLTDLFQASGIPLDHNRVGSHLRALCQQRGGFVPANSEPAVLLAQGDPWLEGLLASVAKAWWDGVSRYFVDIDFPAEAAERILTRGFDVILHTVQSEPREVLNNHAFGAATKGGVLEKAIHTFHHLIQPLLAAGVTAGDTLDQAEFTGALTAKVTETAHIVGRHGMKLAG